MVDPRETRSGNWVLQITGKNVSTQAFFEYKTIAFDENYYRFLNAYFPIRITPAILGYCGFKHEFGDWYINRPAEGIEEGLPFLRYRHNDHCWYLGKMKLLSHPVYLHQLQNLFYALSNEELEVDLAGPVRNIVSAAADFFISPIENDSRHSKLLYRFG